LQDECKQPICVFSDTKREDEDTYRFGKQVAQRWELDLRNASTGEDLWNWFRANNMIPARQLSPCARHFKIEPSQLFLSTITGDARVAYGYDINETERAERTATNWKIDNLSVWFPLIEWGVSKSQCFGYFQEHNIAPPRMYQHFQHANCLPCKNFRMNDWLALAYHYPDKFAEAMVFEEQTGLKWMQDEGTPRLKEILLQDKAPSRKGRRKLAGDEPAFSFEMGCDRCAID
jgi:hypothetical protein